MYYQDDLSSVGDSPSKILFLVPSSKSPGTLVQEAENRASQGATPMHTPLSFSSPPVLPPPPFKYLNFLWDYCTSHKVGDPEIEDVKNRGVKAGYLQRHPPVVYESWC